MKKQPIVKKKKAVKKAPDTNVFTLTLTLSDKTYVQKANTILETIQGMSPDIIKTRGTFVLTNGKMTAERTFYVAQLKKLLANKTAKEIFAKRMSDALGIVRVI